MLGKSNVFVPKLKITPAYQINPINLIKNQLQTLYYIKALENIKHTCNFKTNFGKLNNSA